MTAAVEATVTAAVAGKDGWSGAVALSVGASIVDAKVGAGVEA